MHKLLGICSMVVVKLISGYFYTVSFPKSGYKVLLLVIQTGLKQQRKCAKLFGIVLLHKIDVPFHVLIISTKK